MDQTAVEPPSEVSAMAGEQQVPGFGTRLLNLCKAVWQVTKRNSQLLSLKTKTEKLSRIDLRQAFADLGRRCYELKLNQDRLGTHYLEIEALEQRICEKKKGVHAEDGATAMNKLRAVAEDQASKMTAEALTLKLGGMMAEVGKVAAASGDAALPSQELRLVREIEASVEEMRTQMTNIDGSSFAAAFKALFQRRAPDRSAKPSVPRMITGVVGGVILLATVVVPLGHFKHPDGVRIALHIYENPGFSLVIIAAALVSILFSTQARFGALFITGLFLCVLTSLFNSFGEVSKKIASNGLVFITTEIPVTLCGTSALLVLAASLPWFWKSKR
ncbi:MAG: hypothetical protein J0L73_08565 [Verrucomicrobia bacterium]|nr:hypothetical protein [Verrucomicrobiota bacterium]